MDIPADLVSLGVALALGLLVGMQRERVDKTVAGVRTFAIITMLGALAAVVQRQTGAWLIPAALVVIMGAAILGEYLSATARQKFDGITTIAAAGVMVVVGSLCALEQRMLAIAAAGMTYLLLYAKDPLHQAIGRMSATDVRAISTFVLISMVILPVLPDESFGPYDVLNPRRIWLMVVLVVSISLAGYVLHKFVAGRGGLVINGILGGLISSTATTVGMARRAAGMKSAAGPAAVVLIATAVVYIRVAVVAGVTSPTLFAAMAVPLGLMFLASLAAVLIELRRGSGSEEYMAEPSNPTELRSAVIFALVFALVLLTTSFAKEQFGNSGLYVVSAISGLVDMDAITLSAAGMTASGTAEPGLAWRAIVIAIISNLIFKGGVAWVMGGPQFGRVVTRGFLIQGIAGAGLVVFWP